jgi:hypothetical protein
MSEHDADKPAGEGVDHRGFAEIALRWAETALKDATPGEHDVWVDAWGLHTLAAEVARLHGLPFPVTAPRPAAPGEGEGLNTEPTDGLRRVYQAYLDNQALLKEPVQTRGGEEVERLREALKAAEQFIANGIEMGFIRMPDDGTPDPAHNTLPMIRAALAPSAARDEQTGGGR